MSELYIKQELIKTLGQIDAVILDIDGVVLDVSQSFRVAISQTVQIWATQWLGLSGEATLLPLAEIEGFKMAGGFNSDWDLTNAACALILARRVQSGETETAKIAAQGPTWDDYTRDLKRRGGGLVNAESFVLNLLTPHQRRDWAQAWNPKLVTQLFQEIYGGTAACRALYGFDPQHIQQDGLYKNETVLLDVSLLPPKLKIGVLTGRTNNETKLALKVAALREKIPALNWVTEDDGVRKPDGRTLVLLQDKMKFNHAIFIGDTMDDLNAVVNYRDSKGAGRARVHSCIVLSGPTGEKNRRAFLEAGTEIVAPSANALLEYLNHIL